MKNRTTTLTLTAAITLLAGLWGMQHARAQAQNFKRTELQKHDLAVKGHEAVMSRGEFQPGGVVPKHTHPGEEVGYVLEGEVTVELAGKPPMTLKAGDTFFIPAGTVHSATNAGKAAAIVISTYIVEKGKPLATFVK